MRMPARRAAFEYLLFYSSSDLNRNFIDWLELQSSSHIKFQEVLI